jgi:hypothetical protein
VSTAGELTEGGLRVALVERELLGGDCSYWGWENEEFEKVAKLRIAIWAEIREAGGQTPRSIPDPGTVMDRPLTGRLNLRGT